MNPLAQALPALLAQVCLGAIVGFTAAGLVQLIRLSAWVQTAMMAGKKPWVCNLCMSWWCTWIAAGLFSAGAESVWLLVAAAPGFPLALLLTNALGAPQSKPDFSADEIPLIEPPEEP